MSLNQSVNRGTDIMNDGDNMSHTPGPWILSGNTRTWGVESEDGDTLIANDIGNHANACLIASAPELLATLYDLVAEIKGNHDWRGDEYLSTLIPMADAAIAKAEGRRA